MPEERLFSDFWHLAAHRSELAQAGDFLKLSLLGQDLVLANDNGSILAFDNICPHRGARIVGADCGRAPLTCPYHGWTYAGGKFRIPGREQFDPAVLEQVRYRTYETAWCGDFVFVSPAPRQSLEQQLGGIAPLIENIGACIARRHDFHHFQFDCDWKVAIENALEPYHIDLIHRATLGKMRLPAPRTEYHGINSVAFFEVAEARTKASLERIGRYFDLPFQHAGYFALYLFPFAMISSTYGYSYSMQHFVPAPQEKTNFYTRVLAARLKDEGGRDLEASLLASTVEMNRKVFQEDHEICQRVARVFPADTGMIYGSAEQQIVHFHRSYLEAMGMATPA
ncbi:MAG TPA: Rieske 2Fe-2S domain-containing protein [Burkholderiales bacterium]|jgi:phenylpropionate dioxygenase-like ring-hydroxylating dioxygenase large terminal subunit|nr:Rieske 2Fe-2S domain-containing protein [Burkholderiales bacterium]